MLFLKDDNPFALGTLCGLLGGTWGRGFVVWYLSKGCYEMLVGIWYITSPCGPLQVAPSPPFRKVAGFEGPDGTE